MRNGTLRLIGRTLPFHGKNRGSNPLGSSRKEEAHDSSAVSFGGPCYVKHEFNPGSVGRLGDGLIHASLLENSNDPDGARWLRGE